MGGIAAAIGAGATIYGIYAGSQAAKKEAKYNSKIAANNQKIAKMQAQDIVTRGAVSAVELERDALRFADDQLLGFAAGNIDVTSGVAQKAIEDTARITAADIITLQHNVKRDVWAAEVGASSEAAQSQLENIRARNAQRASNIQLAATLLTTGVRLSKGV